MSDHNPGDGTEREAVKDAPHAFLKDSVAPLDLGDVCLSGSVNHFNTHVVGDGVEWRFAFTVAMDVADDEVAVVVDAQNFVGLGPSLCGLFCYNRPSLDGRFAPKSIWNLEFLTPKNTKIRDKKRRKTHRRPTMAMIF